MFNKSSPITFSRVGISLRVPGSSTTNLRVLPDFKFLKLNCRLLIGKRDDLLLKVA